MAGFFYAVYFLNNFEEIISILMFWIIINKNNLDEK